MPRPKKPAAKSRRGKRKTTKSGRKTMAGAEETAAPMRGERVPGLVVHRSWDIAAALDTPERIALNLEEAKEDGDPQLIAAAIEDVARAARKQAKRQRARSASER